MYFSLKKHQTLHSIPVSPKEYEFEVKNNINVIFAVFSVNSMGFQIISFENHRISRKNRKCHSNVIFTPNVDFTWKNEEESNVWSSSTKNKEQIYCFPAISQKALPPGFRQNDKVLDENICPWVL